MITVDLKVLLILTIILALIVLTAYLVAVLRKLLITLDETNKILSDVSVVSEIAAEKVERSEEAVDQLLEAVDSFARAMRGQEGVISSLSNIAKSVATIGSYFKK